jgi:hypothetical protein
MEAVRSSGTQEAQERGRNSVGLHGITPQKIVLFTVTTRHCCENLNSHTLHLCSFVALGDNISDPYTRREIGYCNHYDFR